MKFKDITCISDIYYVIGRWFTVIMVLISFVTVPFALDKWDSPFSFLCCGGIAFVGVAADYRDKTELPVHYISAMISAVCSVLYAAVVQPLALTALLLCIMAVDNRQRWLLWCEVPCFLMFYISLI